MWKAIALKELRELAPLAGVALVAYGGIVAHALGVDLALWPAARPQPIPFVTDAFVMQTTLVACCLAFGLALKQTLAESTHGTWLWLLHRPVPRSQIVAAKLATGGLVYLTCAGLPIVFYACWAAWPGTHASPFYWSMTESAWLAWAIVGVLYLATFLSALRPGHWIGTRLLPLLGTFTLAALYDLFQWRGSWLAVAAFWLLLILLGAAVATCVQFVARVRDF